MLEVYLYVVKLSSILIVHWRKEMARNQRVKLIEKIEKERGSHVVTYVTSTRKNFEAPMAMDAVRRIYDHLNGDDKVEQVDLFLHSNGGEGTVPWRLVTLIRERAKKFALLVPCRAFSAATLTALGADEVVMHPMGMLGPTDPTVSNPFNPRDPTNPMRQIGCTAPLKLDHKKPFLSSLNAGSVSGFVTMRLSL